MNLIKFIINFLKKVNSNLFRIKHIFMMFLFYERSNLSDKRSNLLSPAIILMGEPEYNNLGDHAIAYATQIFVENNFSNVEFFSISEDDIRYNMKNVRKIIRHDDLLLLQGGGNMGDIYPDQVAIRKKVIKSFKNQIIVMPQTISYSKTPKLPSYYKKNAERITLFAREQKSFDLMKNLFFGDVKLCPDIVLYLNDKIGISDDKQERYGVSVCLRSDKEKMAGFISESQIDAVLREKNADYKKISTIAHQNICSKERKDSLKTLFLDFSKTNLVITDRLHGMIIAAITKTPCIVIPTFNHKLVYSFLWLKEFNYIVLLHEPNELGKEVEKLVSLKILTDERMSNKFDELKKTIREKGRFRDEEVY